MDEKCRSYRNEIKLETEKCNLVSDLVARLFSFTLSHFHALITHEAHQALYDGLLNVCPLLRDGLF